MDSTYPVEVTSIKSLKISQWDTEKNYPCLIIIHKSWKLCVFHMQMLDYGIAYTQKMDNK